MSWLITLVAGFVGVSRPLAAIIAWAVLALAVSVSVFGSYELIKHWGADEQRAKIEKENNDAIKKGIDARMSFDDCLAAGGVYDFRRQWCSSPALGPR